MCFFVFSMMSMLSGPRDGYAIFMDVTHPTYNPKISMVAMNGCKYAYVFSLNALVCPLFFCQQTILPYVAELACLADLVCILETLFAPHRDI